MACWRHPIKPFSAASALDHIHRHHPPSSSFVSHCPTDNGTGKIIPKILTVVRSTQRGIFLLFLWELLFSSCCAIKWQPVHCSTLSSHYIESSPSSGYCQSTYTTLNCARSRSCSVRRTNSFRHELTDGANPHPHADPGGDNGRRGRGFWWSRSIKHSSLGRPYGELCLHSCLDSASCHRPSCLGWPSISMHHPLNMQSRLPPRRRAIKSERSREGRV